MSTMTVALSVLRSAPDGESYLSYDLSVTGDFTPGRPAPFSTNPDSAAFSDTGDPPKFEVEKVDVDCVTDEDGEVVDATHRWFSQLPKEFKLSDDERQQACNQAQNEDWFLRSAPEDEEESDPGDDDTGWDDDFESDDEEEDDDFEEDDYDDREDDDFEEDEIYRREL